jgi:hypothetical protein
MLYLVQNNVAVPKDNMLRSLALYCEWESDVKIIDFFYILLDGDKVDGVVAACE